MKEWSPVTILDNVEKFAKDAGLPDDATLSDLKQKLESAIVDHARKGSKKAAEAKKSPIRDNKVAASEPSVKT